MIMVFFSAVPAGRQKNQKTRHIFLWSSFFERFFNYIAVVADLLLVAKLRDNDIESDIMLPCL